MERVAQKVFDILNNKLSDPEIKSFDANSKDTTDIEEARIFSFDFVVGSHNYGPVVVLLSSEDDLEIFYGDNTSKTLEKDARNKWDSLIKHLSNVAQRSRLGFKLKNIKNLKYDLSKVSENVTESYKNIFEGYYGTSKTSYNKQGKAKIIIKHSRKLGEDEQRFRNISSLYVENADGERFKLPFKKLAGARAMVRHVQEGGTPYDLFGMHISEMVKDIGTLSGFVRRSKSITEDDEAFGLVETGRTHYNAMRKSLKQIGGKRGYHTYKEGWEPSEISEQERDVNSIRSLFTERSVDSKIEEALPLLARLQELAEKQIHPMGEPMGHNEVDDDDDELIEISDEEKQANRDWNARPEVSGIQDRGGYETMEPMDWMKSDKEDKLAKGKKEKQEWDDALGYDPFDKMMEPDDELDEVKEFEAWANNILEGGDNSEIDILKQFMAQEQPYGIDGINVLNELSNVIADNDFDEAISIAASKNPDGDAREAVANWISQNDMDLAHALDLHGEYDNPAARDFPREALENEIDADSDEQLNASVNKDLDKYKQHKNVKEFAMKDLNEYMDEVDEGQQIQQDVMESKEAETKEEDLTELIQRTNYLLNK